MLHGVILHVQYSRRYKASTHLLGGGPFLLLGNKRHTSEGTFLYKEGRKEGLPIIGGNKSLRTLASTVRYMEREEKGVSLSRLEDFLCASKK